MICLETQHFNINKFLLLTIGLWPYRQSKFTHLQFLIISAILITAVVFQLTAFFTSKCTSNFVLNILSITFFFTTFIIKYSSFRVNMEHVKDLLEQLQHICNKLKDECEIAIIEKYGYYAKCYTVALSVFGLSAIFAFIISQLWSIILKVAVPINESRSQHLLFMTEYFLDREKNFYLNLMHMNVAFSIGVIAVVAIGTIQIAYIQHTCGMFKIASYRIQHIAELNVRSFKLQNVRLKSNTLISREMSCAVDMHRQAMKFETSFFWLIVFGVASLSLNILRISQIDSFMNDVKEFLLHSFLSTSCIMYMFLANYCGQEVTDHNNNVFETAYNTHWYTASLNTQKLILILLQRSAKNFTVGVGGLFVGSLDCFASLVKASVSYFTFIYSTQ